MPGSMYEKHMSRGYHYPCRTGDLPADFGHAGDRSRHRAPSV